MCTRAEAVWWNCIWPVCCWMGACAAAAMWKRDAACARTKRSAQPANFVPPLYTYMYVSLGRWVRSVCWNVGGNSKYIIKSIRHSRECHTAGAAESFSAKLFRPTALIIELRLWLRVVHLFYFCRMCAPPHFLSRSKALKAKQLIWQIHHWCFFFKYTQWRQMKGNQNESSVRYFEKVKASRGITPRFYASTCAQMISFLVNHSVIMVTKCISSYIWCFKKGKA